MRQALEAKLGRPIPWVFFYERGYHGAGAGDRIMDFRGTWKKVVKVAKIGHRLFHDYRRSAIRNVENSGVPRSSAMQVSGRKTESVYRRYAIRNPEDLKEATRRIEEQKAKAKNALEAMKPRANNGQTRAQTTLHRNRQIRKLLINKVSREWRNWQTRKT